MSATKIPFLMVEQKNEQFGPVNVRNLGAKGDGVADDTDAINAAYQIAYDQKRSIYFPSGIYPVRESASGSKACIINYGVNTFGDGARTTWIIPFGDVATDVDFMKIAPQVGNYNDFLRVKDIAIWPAYPAFSTSVKGNRCIWVVTDFENMNLAKLQISGCYFFPSNGYSVHTENNPTKLPQGCPSNSYICDNAMWGGLKMSYCGDSNNIERNVIRTGANFVCGIEMFTVGGSLGSAGHNMIFANNIDCAGGGILLRSGRHFHVLSNNIEQSTGSGTSVGACVELRGDLGRLDMPVVRGNVSALFGSSIAQRALLVGNCDKAEVDGNKYDSDSPRSQAVWVRGGADKTLFGINELTGTWAAKVTNEGSNTRSYSVANGYTPS